jgi:hypothetical protein
MSYRLKNEYTTCRLHSERWQELVAQGWFTWTVKGDVATMRRQ